MYLSIFAEIRMIKHQARTLLRNTPFFLQLIDFIFQIEI